MTKLEELVKCIKGKHIYIQTHNFPDPDSLASGIGLKYLLQNKGIEATVCYGGVIDRPGTQRMVEIFGIELLKIETKEEYEKNAEIILVDTQIVHGNVDVKPEYVIATIDNHPTVEEHSYKFMDVQEGRGACATIVASYFFDNDIEMPMDIAELLLFGIKSDTANLTRNVSRKDLDMFYNTFVRSKQEKIKILENNSIREADLQAYVKAINGIKVRDCVSFTYAGDECSKSLTATISDFMLKLVTVSFSVVCSKRDSGYGISVRSELRTFNSGVIVMNALDGIGTGGGHSTMAAGFIPYKNVINLSTDEIMELIEDRIMNEIEKIKSVV